LEWVNEYAVLAYTPSDSACNNVFRPHSDRTDYVVICFVTDDCSRKLYGLNKSIGVQGHARSPMLINLNIPSPVLVMICSMFISICNRFHTRRANSGKITFLGGCPSLTPSFKRNPLTQGHEILSQKN